MIKRYIKKWISFIYPKGGLRKKARDSFSGFSADFIRRYGLKDWIYH